MEKRQEDGETVTHLSKVEARSGSRTTVTRSILVTSLALVIAALLIVVAIGYFRADKTGADEVNSDNRAGSAAPRTEAVEQ
ncbi:hypothetical protein SAMN05518668_106367 [Sphingobium sp. YR657]|nr:MULTISPECIES: hypothetical protein [Sphingobium]SHM20318.1 hypothetical protein SAMN05518668_106367 [Sphingobium sp. YR657]